MEASPAIKAENAGAVRSDHPLRANRSDRGDPVVLKVRSLSGVVHRDVAFIEKREAAERAGNEFVAGNAERIDVVIHQSMERVHAAGAARVEEGQPGRGRQREAVAVGSDVGHVVGDKAVGAS